MRTICAMLLCSVLAQDKPVEALFAAADAEFGFDKIATEGVNRAQVADLNGDGLDDLILSTGDAANPCIILLHKPGSGFVDATATSGLKGALVSTAAWGDVDNDGDIDLVNCAATDPKSEQPAACSGVWLNGGKGAFKRAGLNGLQLNTTKVPYDHPHSITLADFDRDGNLDVYVCTWYGKDGAGNLIAPTVDRLFRGKGDGTFEDATAALGGVVRPTFGVAPGDFDNDGDVDLFVSSYGAGRPRAGLAPDRGEYNLLWRNDGGMKFSEIAQSKELHASWRGIGGVEDERTAKASMPYGPVGGNTFGSTWGDIDNDGDLDLLVTNIAHPDHPTSDRTLLYVNSGAPDYRFSEESAARGLAYREYELHPAFVDVDQDGRLDLAICGQWDNTFGGNNWEFYLQGGDGKFQRQSYAASGVDDKGQAGMAWIDLDRDGDLDLVMPKFKGPMRVFKNLAGTKQRRVTVRLDGGKPADDTGARVTLRTSTGLQLREVVSGAGHGNPQASHLLVFGLGGDAKAKEVTVRWPDGKVEKFGDLAAGRDVVLKRGGGVRDFAVLGSR